MESSNELRRRSSPNGDVKADSSNNDDGAQTTLPPSRLQPPSVAAEGNENVLMTVLWFVLKAALNILLMFGVGGILAVVIAVVWLYVSDGLIEVRGVPTPRVTF